MNVEELTTLFQSNQTNTLVWNGICHDCQQEVQVKTTADTEKKEITIEGGAVFNPNKDNVYFLKCDDCMKKDPILKNYQDMDVYSRVVGYLRPVNQWNDAKQSEFELRQTFKQPTVS